MNKEIHGIDGMSVQNLRSHIIKNWVTGKFALLTTIILMSEWEKWETVSWNHYVSFIKKIFS